MDKGLIYNPADPKIMEEQAGCLDLQYEYNSLRPSQFDEKTELLKKMFGAVGKNCYVEQPLHSNWAGKHVFIGDNFYSNFNLTLVDDGNIFIGDNVLIGPNVTVATAGHPVNPELREKALQFNREVHIGSNVWIGANAVVLPGVTIGENSVIGAGSVVTKDIPSNVVAVGNPCRVLREISDRDREFYYKNERIDISAGEIL